MERGFEEFKATLLPMQTVGVQGDGRSYGKYLVGITGELDWDRTAKLAQVITNNIHEVNRVAYVFNRDSLASAESTPTKLTTDVISQLQEADDITNRILRAHKCIGLLSQMPVILCPVSFDKAGMRSIAIRPFFTPDFMTGLAALPNLKAYNKRQAKALNDAYYEIAKRLPSEVEGISAVMIDVTNKPPGTTEWE